MLNLSENIRIFVTHYIHVYYCGLEPLSRSSYEYIKIYS